MRRLIFVMRIDWDFDVSIRQGKRRSDYYAVSGSSWRRAVRLINAVGIKREIDTGDKVYTVTNDILRR